MVLGAGSSTVWVWALVGVRVVVVVRLVVVLRVVVVALVVVVVVALVVVVVVGGRVVVGRAVVVVVVVADVVVVGFLRIFFAGFPPTGVITVHAHITSCKSCCLKIWFQLKTFDIGLMLLTRKCALLHLTLNASSFTLLDKAFLAHFLQLPHWCLVDDLIHGLQPHRVWVPLLYLQGLFQQHHPKLTYRIQQSTNTMVNLGLSLEREQIAPKDMSFILLQRSL